ncbi:MAG: hypothetical protein E4H23_04705 [Chrysiogenales bacterium]|nr:MAG: hypothetical protein E4H23_04705 [Chrysiogenales bacterium]
MSDNKEKKSKSTNLYEVRHFLREKTRQDFGIYLDDVFGYLQDPWVARKTGEAGIKPFRIEWEPGLADGPTNSRLAVVDFNADTGLLVPPAKWDKKQYKFVGPKGEILDAKHSDLYQFHQVNAWAVVQSVLDMFEGPLALGRPIPWGTDGNRLILVPHAGFGENAFYDRRSKALQFYYYGDPASPKYTCLSHDIIVHETGHAILDGIRPYYFLFSSTETAAFHEFVADLSALLAALRNNYLRHVVSDQTQGDLSKDNFVSSLAEEFGAHLSGKAKGKPKEIVGGIAKLRDANNSLKMADIRDGDSPHRCSQVLTGAIYDLLKNIAKGYQGKVNQKFWWATERLIRMALQPLDFCPPVDVRFADYARALARNFELYEPLDSKRREAYAGFIKNIFLERGICDPDSLNAHSLPGEWDVYHDINAISGSRTGAYYFLNDNRKALHIPWNQDLLVSDLYMTNKYGRAGCRLPREVVLEYVWREEFKLDEDRFGPLKGQTAELLCGGTLVLDERGNVLSWQHKPGSQEKQDRDEGEKRLAQLRDHIANHVQDGLVGLRGESEVDILGPWTPPVVADTSSGALRLEIAPHLRDSRVRLGGGSAGLAGKSELDEWGDNKWTIKF